MLVGHWCNINNTTRLFIKGNIYLMEGERGRERETRSRIMDQYMEVVYKDFMSLYMPQWF